MSIFDGLMDPASVGAAFGAGMKRGQAEREEREVKGALSAYAANPSDPAAFQMLAQYRPELAIQLGEQQRKRAQAAEVQRLTGLAAQGDKAAAAQLAGIDIDAWSKIDTRQRTAIKERVDYIGQAALAISRLPAAERSAAWDRYIEQGVQAGHADLAEYHGKYSEDALNSAIANAGQVKQLLDLTEPHYQTVPEGGSLVNTNDPNAVRSFAGGAAPTQTKTIGGKTYYQTPDGKWHDEPVGGGAGNGTDGFRGG